MSFHVALLGEFPVAAGTLERLHPVVAEGVPLEAVQGKETFGALGAQVRALPRVGAGVDDEVTLAGEALPAVDAGVRHLARVRAVVQPQLPGGQKRLPACGAEEVPFASVHLHVSDEAVFAEVSGADDAEIGGTFMQPLVLLESVAAQESLVALLTCELAPSLVKSLMVIISRLAREPFLALNAAVAEGVELHVRRQLIRMFKCFLTRWAFSFCFREASVHRPRTQKPFIFPCGLFSLPPTFVLRSVLLLVTFLVLVNVAFLSASL